MKLRVKELGICTGGPLIAVMHESDAKLLDLHPADRIKIIKGDKIETVSVDISKKNHIPKGWIGVMGEVSSALNTKNSDIVEIMIARKPVSLDYIKKKLDGHHLAKAEIDQIVWDIVHNKLREVELTFFVAACYCHQNNMDETVWLTKAIANEGQKLELDSKIILDKHCIGGIPGNRTTPIVVPIMAAAGYVMPKTSSRAITSPAGTADTMEVLCKVSFPLDRMKEIVKKVNACIVWGGALNLAPADDKIINVEKTLMIDAESQLLASIMAKKNSVSSTHVVIDIPIGPNTKITNKKRAQHLEKKFRHIGKKLGMKVKAVLTDGKQPIGNGIGPALEAIDVLKVLSQDADRPMDLERKCLMLATELFKLVGRFNGKKLAESILRSGRAYEKFKEILQIQEGNSEVRPEDIEVGKFTYDFVADDDGIISSINNQAIAKIARVAGAPLNKCAGIFLHKHIDEEIKKGEKIFTVYAGSKDRIQYVKQLINSMDDIVGY